MVLPSLFACGTGDEKIGASCKRDSHFRFVGAACRPRIARAGFRIPVPQPSLTNLNLLFMVGGLVRLFLFISKMNPDFLAFRCVQCSIGLADVNVKKYHRKMKIDIEQPGSDTWFFLYPNAIFFRVLKTDYTSR